MVRARSPPCARPVSLRLKWTGAKPAPVDDKPVLYVLSIGVSEYIEPDNRLKFAAKDAIDFAAIVQIQKGKLYRDVVVKLLQADSLRLAFKRRTPGATDAVAGHGQFGKTFAERGIIEVADIFPAGPDGGGGMRGIGPPPAVLPCEQGGHARGIDDPPGADGFGAVAVVNGEKLFPAGHELHFLHGGGA